MKWKENRLDNLLLKVFLFKSQSSNPFDNLTIPVCQTQSRDASHFFSKIPTFAVISLMGKI